MFNRDFAAIDKNFLAACQRATDARRAINETAPPLLPTRRQASKFRRGFGTAYKFRQVEHPNAVKVG